MSDAERDSAFAPLLTRSAPKSDPPRKSGPHLDAWMMRAALAAAFKGVGRVKPNPPVGAVLARGRKVIAVGHHKRAGGPHAEVAVLRSAKAPSAGPRCT